MYLCERIRQGDQYTAAQFVTLQRFVANLRAQASPHITSEARLQGYFATSADRDPDQSNRESADLIRRMDEIRTQLVTMGLPEASIYRVGVAHDPRSGGDIVLTSGSIWDLSKPSSSPPVALPPDHPDASQAGTRPRYQGSEDDVESEVSFDPKDKEIKTEVKVTYKAGGLPSARILAVTMAIGPDGRLAEVGTELKLFKEKIVKSWAAGIFKDVQFSVKVTSTYNIEKEELKTKLKGALDADIGVPNTEFRIGTELSGYVDAAGKPGVALNLTLFKF